MDRYNVLLTEEEYDAIMEAREYMEEKSNFDKYLNSKANKAKEAYRKYKTYNDIADSATSSSVRDKAREKARKYQNEYHKSNRLDDTGNSVSDIKDKHDRSKRGQDIGEYSRDDIRNSRDLYKRDEGQRPEERYKANRYLNAQNAIRGKKAVKEAVLDWYEENGYEIDDYEMGRIDSFVENYIEENF